jgi:predicted RNA-binding protein with PIN domain
MVEQADNPKRIVVVSDDREIQLFVKSLGAKTLSVKSFVQRSKNKIESFPVSKEELPSPKARAITEELKKIWLK